MRSSAAKDRIRQKNNIFIEFITFLQHVFFYMRFIFIYLLSAFSAILVNNLIATIAFLASGLIITGVLTYRFGNRNDESIQVVDKIDTAHEENNIKPNNKVNENNKLPMLFLVCTQYIFDVSCMFQGDSALKNLIDWTYFLKGDQGPDFLPTAFI